MKIIAISGSLRAVSLNTAVLHAGRCAARSGALLIRVQHGSRLATHRFALHRVRDTIMRYAVAELLSVQFTK